MTFPARLTELIEKGYPANASANFLEDYAEAIRDLVVAVDELEYAGRELV